MERFFWVVEVAVRRFQVNKEVDFHRILFRIL